MPAPDERSTAVPPEPATTPPIKAGDGKPFENNWLVWFRNVRIKVNILNESIVNLAGLVGTGFLVKNGVQWLLRVLTPGTAINISNPDGVAGNPVISHADTSSVADLLINNSGVVVLQDVTMAFDSMGHVLSVAFNSVDLAGSFEPAIAAGTTAQFWRGDKTWSDTLVGNFTIGTTPSYGSGTYVFFLQNASVVPSVNPTGGAIHYAEGGAAKVRGSSGTITTYGPANPHCPECKSDFVREYESAVYGYLAKCDFCAANGINSFTRTKGAWNVQE
jgi:hypothetical protein